MIISNNDDDVADGDNRFKISLMSDLMTAQFSSAQLSSLALTLIVLITTLLVIIAAVPSDDDDPADNADANPNTNRSF